jgi:quercetin dioxygenase-like cupin family protein
LSCGLLSHLIPFMITTKHCTIIPPSIKKQTAKMLNPITLFSFLLLLTATPTIAKQTLWLKTTPQSPIPYALKKGAGISLGGGNTFPITGNSSGGTFCLLHTNAAGSYSSPSSGPGLFPHVHKKTYENFYAVKGRVQLWGQNLDSFLLSKNKTSVGEQETRILSQGDIGAIPWNTIHTFTLLEPDTQLTGVLVPGGVEEFFFNMAVSPSPPPPSGSGGGTPPLPGFDIPSLAKWDVYPQLDFIPRRDVVNGKAGGAGNWYNGPNPLPADAKAPIWVAKNYGPKYLNEQGGRYQIVAPFVTGTHTNGTFSQGALTISPFSSSSSSGEKINSTVATAFLVEEGQLEVTVEGYDEPAVLINGDVVFVPANTSFSYAATAEFTKVMYITGGGQGLDKQLIDKGRAWNSAFYPAKGPTSPRAMMRI